MSTEMKNNEKKFTYSKAIVFATGLIFISCVIFTIVLYLSEKIGTVIDATAIVSLITVSGTIFGSNLCWYSKKAASENHYKLRMSLYADSAQVRLNYNEKMIQLIKKYNVSQECIDKINDTGDADDMMDESLRDVVSDLDATRDDADCQNTVETFNI